MDYQEIYSEWLKKHTEEQKKQLDAFLEEQGLCIEHLIDIIDSAADIAGMPKASMPIVKELERVDNFCS